MEDFSKISLGFAEFVSQLLHETFEATLSAQNYQIEKYLEIENILKLPNKRFFELYLNKELLEEKTLNVFGAPIVNQMNLSVETISIMEDLFDDISKFVKSGKLTVDGFNAIHNEMLNQLVTEKRSVFQNIMNNTELARLVVDSGEIRAKLELSNLSQNLAAEGQTTTLKSSNTKKQTTRFSDKQEVKPASSVITGKSILSNNIKVTEINNAETSDKIWIVDKSSFTDKSNVAFSIPNVRIIAKPATTSSNSNLLSEVIIKFKTV